MSNKKTQHREGKPKALSSRQKTWSNQCLSLLILKEANQSLATPYKITFLNDPKETKHHIGMALLYLEDYLILKT